MKERNSSEKNSRLTDERWLRSRGIDFLTARGLLQNLTPDEAAAIQTSILSLTGFESRTLVKSLYTFKFVITLELSLKTET
jgi:hypothetical protein